VVLTLIVVCEVAFWVLLGAGLVTRYLVRWRRLGAALLVGTAMVDVVLFVATVVDLRRGATANVTHGLAAAYIGFSVAFGATMVRWADQRFAHRFASGPPPWRPPKRGWPRARYEWREWGKGMLGWAVAVAMLLAGIGWIGAGPRTEALAAWVGRLSVAMLVWLVGWPVWASVSALAADRRDRTGS
jgi:hypothetical protein